ncbi:MAG: LPS export ABC transporter periplasmic protein LptC [Alphaproteobacteria bacterium]|nr:LPS export ABC transporter periplasmic protein LptC [Alphaproteobacteria bacterium]
MFDLRQLDYIFNHNGFKKDFNAEDVRLQKQKKIVRLLKISLPAVAAALIGLLAVLPTLQERAELFNNSIKPSHQELEKLHIENTQLFMTDKKNRVNSFTADTVDETKPKSQILKIINPKGRLLLTEDKWVDIKSPLGFYNQKKKFVDMKNNVEIEYNDGMKAKTKEMFYDADLAKIYSNTPVSAWGKYGNLSSEKFVYSVDDDLLTFFGNTNIDANEDCFGERTQISTKKTAKFYQREQKLEAEGDAQLVRDGMTINGDTITAIFSKAGDKTVISDFSAKDNVVVNNGDRIVKADYLKAFFKNGTNNKSVIEKVEMTGDVRSTTEGRQVRADKGIYHPDTQIIEMMGNVNAQTADGEIFAQKGVYYPDSGFVKLTEKVTILKNGNKILSDYAETNLNTGVSKMGTKDKSGKTRVSGVFYENTFKKDKQN